MQGRHNYCAAIGTTELSDVYQLKCDGAGMASLEEAVHVLRMKQLVDFVSDSDHHRPEGVVQVVVSCCALVSNALGVHVELVVQCREHILLFLHT